jgi:hypothetical protein
MCLITDCLDIIERNIKKIEYANHNGGIADVDTEEVEKWQRKVLTGKLGRSKGACP